MLAVLPYSYVSFTGMFFIYNIPNKRHIIAIHFQQNFKRSASQSPRSQINEAKACPLTPVKVGVAWFGLQLKGHAHV